MKHRNLDHLDAGNRTRTHLATIRRYYDTALDGPKAVDESEIKSGAAPEPLSLDVLEARRDVLHDLHFWAKFILDEVNGGTITTTVQPTVPDMAAFIDRWCDLLIEQFPDDAANLEAETGKHARKLEALSKGWRTKRVQIGKCPEQTVTGEPGQETFEPCNGTLWALVREQDTLLPEVIKCDADDDHQWLPWQWPALGRRLGGPITEMIA